MWGQKGKGEEEKDGGRRRGRKILHGQCSLGNLEQKKTPALRPLNTRHKCNHISFYLSSHPVQCIGGQHMQSWLWGDGEGTSKT